MKKIVEFEILNSHCAGIDVGSRSHYVAVGQEDSQVREFGVCTKDFESMSKFLREHHITHIAMESTGSYFQALFLFLQLQGFEVILIHGGVTKNISGKKTDVIDCKWIQKLYSLGFLKSCFLPSNSLNDVRTLYRHRLNLLEESSRLLNRMNKSLRLMNIRLDNAINDLAGKTGQAILSAIVLGEREAQKLAQLADSRIRISKQELEEYLIGCWNEQQLYVLEDCYKSYLEVRLRIQKCDDKIDSCFSQIIESQGEESSEPITLKKKQKSKNSLGYNVSKISYQLYGVDLMEIECVSEATVNSLICEIGRDIYKFSSAKKFVSWLRLAPNNKVSGGKVISSRTPKSVNRFTLTLRNAANTIGNLKSGYLNHCFKRLAFNKGRGAAITAIARKLAVIIWKMISLKQSYHPFEKELQSEKQKIKIIKQLKSKIKQMNINPIELGFDFQAIVTSKMELRIGLCYEMKLCKIATKHGIFLPQM